MPNEFQYAFFVQGGAQGVENAMKVPSLLLYFLLFAFRSPKVKGGFEVSIDLSVFLFLSLPFTHSALSLPSLIQICLPMLIASLLYAAMDWKVRKNLARGRGELGHKVIHFREAFHGRTAYALSCTNTADPRKFQYFPLFPWPRIENPKVRLIHG